MAVKAKRNECSSLSTALFAPHLLCCTILAANVRRSTETSSALVKIDGGGATYITATGTTTIIASILSILVVSTPCFM
jgi:hypothetical protein